MDKNKKSEIISELNLLFERNKKSYPEFYHYASEFPKLGPDSFSFERIEDIVKFDRIIDDIWNSNSFNKKFARKTILKKIEPFVSKNEISITEFNEVVDCLKRKPIHEYWIYKEAEGLVMSTQEEAELGPFVFYKQDKFINEIYTESAKQIIKLESILKNKENPVIGIKIEVCDLPRAYELADIKFQQLENILKFIYSDFNKEYEPSIVQKRDFKTSTSFAMTKNMHGWSSKANIMGFRNIEVDLNDLNNQELGTMHLFEIINKENNSQIETRIIKSINWIGSGLAEIDSSKAFIQIMFAIEAILNYDDKTIIQPSILSKISEMIAFLLGDTFDERLKIEKDFKRLYGLRSKIAHGGYAEINNGDLILILFYTRELIWKFLKDEELKELTSFNEFLIHIKKMKYS